MINRIKEWDIKNLKINDRQVISLALILSVMALIMAIPSSSNCASANTCTVASTGTFTGNLGIKSNTAFQLTQQHSLAVDQIANWEAVGGNHTGSVIMKDNSGDMNLNGGLVLGTSATSTNGTIRWNGSEVQVYNSGWTGVGGADQNVFTTINGNSGSLTASTTTTSIKLEAAADTNLTVVAAGDKLEIQSAGGGGGYDPKCTYFVYDNSGSTPNNPNGLDLTTELYDYDNCFTLSSNSAGSTITYTDSTTRVFEFYYQLALDTSHSSSNYYVIAIQVGRNQPSSPVNYGRIANQFNTSISSKPENASGFVCLEQNKNFEVGFPAWTNGVAIYGGKDLTYLTLKELPELSTQAQSSGCTNGEIN